MGHLGRFTSANGRSYRKNAKVVCRTPRGLEVGVVLSTFDHHSADSNGDSNGELTDDSFENGEILRRVTPPDEYVIERLAKNRSEAIEVCSDKIQEKSIPAVLLDAEQLFDGQSIYFYFMGETTPELESITDELAETYESKVRFRKFTEKVEEGCGPDCGEKDNGCGTGGGCGSCSLSGGCGAAK